MRLLPAGYASIVLLANLLAVSCDDGHLHHHHGDVIYVDDVSVDISGDAGTTFDAMFEDDDRSQSLTGAVPFSADFLDQVGYFSAVVDKRTGGQESICLRVESTYDAKEACTTAPFGRVSVSLTF